MTGSGWSASQFGVILKAPLVKKANAEERLEIGLQQVRAGCSSAIEAVEVRANARIDQIKSQLEDVILALVGSMGS